ncbi:hypothetical protein QOZ80_5AG0364960 [Eleusine coracana subsp. coracana]|nr:hypothetical protein QOZ80_5AG0364960 [Eleusine coracana subsp. coracana]
MPRFIRSRCRNGMRLTPDGHTAASHRPIHCSRLSSAIARKILSQRHWSSAFSGDDRLSALTDDLLLLILCRLDTRTALATAALSKRWVGLTRGLDTLNFRVSDILPRRYHRGIHIHDEASKHTYGFIVNYRGLYDSIMRYERHAMRAMITSINNFLDADDFHEQNNHGTRRIRTLRLEFFATQCCSCMNRLIAKAIDTWGVEDLEVSGKGTFIRKDSHSFPNRGLCNNPHMSRLRSLKLAACFIPPLQGFTALTSLVLQDLQKSTPAAAYEAICTLCPQLQVLHLKSCDNGGVVAIDAPRSEIRQLIFEDCSFKQIKLYTLPMLENLVVVNTVVKYNLSSFPYLTHLNLTICLGITKGRFCCTKDYFELNLFLGVRPGITNLVTRFTGYDRWFKPFSSTLLLPNLRKLLVADVPSSWDVSWPHLLIEAAPCLESLHINITPWEEEPCDDISWLSSEFCHNQLKELVIVGFEGTKRQIYLINFVIQASTVLQHVSLYKKGHIQYRGFWDWDIVTEQYQWDNEEKVKILKQIAENVSCQETPIQVSLE